MTPRQMVNALICRLFNHKWVAMSSSEEGYNCTRCGARHYGKLHVIGPSAVAGAWQDDSLRRDDSGRGDTVK